MIKIKKVGDASYVGEIITPHLVGAIALTTAQEVVQLADQLNIDIIKWDI